MTGHMRVGFHAPDTVEELAYLVAEAADTRTPLEVMGRGTKREVGRPVQHGAVLSTENLVGVPLYEPSELVVVALAGTPLAQVEADARRERPGASRSSRSISGRCSASARVRPPSAAWSPPICPAAAASCAGAARDHVLGVQAVNGRGDTIRAGGRVMKNVTGYDLARGIAGSWGTLAVMTEVALKVLPAQREVRTVLCFGLADLDRGRGLVPGARHAVRGLRHGASACRAGRALLRPGDRQCRRLGHRHQGREFPRLRPLPLQPAQADAPGLCARARARHACGAASSGTR